MSFHSSCVAVDQLIPLFSLNKPAGGLQELPPAWAKSRSAAVVISRSRPFCSVTSFHRACFAAKISAGFVACAA